MFSVVILTLVLGGGNLTAEESSFPDPGLGTAHVVYLSGGLVYLDSGRKAGLVVGQKVSVIREGEVWTALVVEHVSSSRAACSYPAGKVPAIGDSVSYVKMEEEPEPSGFETDRTAPKESWARRSGFRGRIGVRYLYLNDRASDSGSFSQPALNLRINGTDIGASGFNFSLDSRARRTFRTTTGGTSSSSRTRLYRLSLARWFGEDRLFVSGGRQVSPDLAAVSIFDGILGEWSPGVVSLGGFVGTQPEASTFGFSTEILEYGAYIRTGGGRPGLAAWTATGGFISSRVDGVRSRDFAFVRGRFTGKRVFASLLQEVDFNSDWKIEAGDPTISPTSTILNGRYRFSPLLSIFGSFDNRRSVRLYRDLETPETEFDDDFRMGIMAGADVNPLRNLRLSLSGRTYDGGRGGQSQSVTGSINFGQVSPLRLSLSTRHTYYESPQTQGFLNSLRIGGPVTREINLNLFGGFRDESRLLEMESRTIVRWYGADLDYRIGRGLFFLMSLQGTRSPVESNDQVYSSLSYSF